MPNKKQQPSENDRTMAMFANLTRGKQALEKAVAEPETRPEMTVEELRRQEARSPKQAAEEEERWAAGLEKKLAEQQAAILEEANIQAAKVAKQTVDARIEQEKRKSGPKPDPASKRNDPSWKSCTFYVKRETMDELKDAVIKAQAAGIVVDNSDVVQKALEQALPLLKKETRRALSKLLEEE